MIGQTPWEIYADQLGWCQGGVNVGKSGSSMDIHGVFGIGEIL